MTQNLIVSNGYYTTITAISVLKQLGLFNESKSLLAYFKTMNNDFISENINLSYTAWNFTKIFDFKQYLNLDKFSFDLFKNDLNNNIQNILIPINSSSKKWYYGFKKIYPKANYIFFEEGLMSYVKPIFDLKLRNIISKYSCYFNDFNKNFLTLIYNQFKNFKVVKVIELKYFFDTLTELSNLLNTDIYNFNDSKNVLFLPQYYYTTNKLDNIRKLKEYIVIIKNFLDSGYTVLIKDHPKDDVFGLEYFVKLYLNGEKNVIFLKKITQYPVEIFLNKLNIQFIFSVYSTTLISGSSKLFNLPVFTSYKMLKKRINSFSLYPSVICSLIQKTIPDFKEFLKHYSDNPTKFYNNYNSKNQCDFSNFNLLKLMSNFILKI